MGRQSKSRIALSAFAGMIAAFAFIAGCSTGGGSDTSSAGMSSGPFVPFSFTATGQPGTAARKTAGKSSNQAADVVASGQQTNGFFGMTETDNQDFGTSTGHFEIDHKIGSSPNVWVSRCSEKANTSCSIAGYNLYISDDPNYCSTHGANGGALDNCLTAKTIDSTSNNGTYSIFVSGSKLSSQILALGIDSIDLIAVSNFGFTTTASTDFTSAGIRVGAIVTNDSTGAPTFPDALNGKATIAPKPDTNNNVGVADDPNLDVQYGTSTANWSSTQAADAVFRVTDKNNMNVTAKVAFSIPLTGSLQGGTFNKTPEYGLLAGAELCDVIDTGPTYCPSVTSALNPGFIKLGSMVAAGKNTNLSYASLPNIKFAAMKSSTNNASLKMYNTQQFGTTWTDVTSLNDFVTDMIAEIAMYTSYTQNNAYVSIFYSKASDHTGAVALTNDGLTWNQIGSMIDAPMKGISTITAPNGTFLVSYMNESDGKPYVWYNYNTTDVTWHDAGLYAAFANHMADMNITNAMVSSMSNLTLGSNGQGQGGTIYVSVAWEDMDTLTHYLTTFGINSIDHTWTAIGNDIQATANQESLQAASFESKDQQVAETLLATAYIDENKVYNMQYYDTLFANRQNSWTAVDGLTGYTAVDDTYRTALAVAIPKFVVVKNGGGGTGIYAAAKDANGALKALFVTSINGVVAAEEAGGAIEAADDTSNAFVTYDAFNGVLDAIYFDKIVSAVYAKELDLNMGPK